MMSLLENWPQSPSHCTIGVYVPAPAKGVGLSGRATGFVVPSISIVEALVFQSVAVSDHPSTNGRVDTLPESIT